jgi:methionine biosynthesis protein MetW
MGGGLESPDANAEGIVSNAPDPFRYDNHTEDPYEVAGSIAALIPLRSRVLDVGCGTGSVSRIVMQLASASIVGVEPDADRAALAQHRGLTVHHGYLDEGLLQQLGLFDCVLFADVLEHVPRPSHLLKLARAFVKPGGRIVISVPNVAHWTVRSDILRGRFRYRECGIMDATHLRWFTEENLRLLASESGLRIEIIRYTAGTTLTDYTTRAPMRWLNRRVRDAVVRRLSQMAPGLFACQFVAASSIREHRGGHVS